MIDGFGDLCPCFGDREPLGKGAHLGQAEDQPSTGLYCVRACHIPGLMTRRAFEGLHASPERLNRLTIGAQLIIDHS